MNKGLGLILDLFIFENSIFSRKLVFVPFQISNNIKYHSNTITPFYHNMIKIYKSWLNLVITFHTLGMILTAQASLYFVSSVGHMGICHVT